MIAIENIAYIFQGPDGMEPSGEPNASVAFDAAISSSKTNSNFKILTGDDTDGLICQALLLGNTEAAVELCLQDNRMADAIIIAMTGGSELLAKTQYRYLQVIIFFKFFIELLVAFKSKRYFMHHCIELIF